MKNIMKKLLLAVFSITTTFSLYAQREVPQERMEQIYEEVKTPYKYGLAIAPADNHHKIDCPTVFRQGDKWLMTYVVYNGKSGTDGRGYETDVYKRQAYTPITSGIGIPSFSPKFLYHVSWAYPSLVSTLKWANPTLA